jgi:hypothetical protein
MIAVPRHTLRADSDPTSDDICQAIRELAIEAGFVHDGGAKDGRINTRGLAARLEQNDSTVFMWCNQNPPRLTDFPWIERALGYPNGEILRRAGFVANQDLISFIENYKELSDEWREVLGDYARAAIARSTGNDEALRKTSLAS